MGVRLRKRGGRRFDPVQLTQPDGWRLSGRLLRTLRDPRGPVTSL